MKKIYALFAIMLAIPALSQVKVEEKSVNIEGSKNGFTVYIPFGTQDQIEKALKDEMKDWKGSFKGGKIFFTDDAKLKDISDNTFDAWGIVEENKEGGCTVSIAVDLGGAFLNSKDHSTEFKAMEVRLHKFGVSAAKEVVGDEVKEEEKVLKKKEGDLSDLEKEQEKLEKEIEDYKKKIKDNEKSIEESKKAQGDKKGEITEQKAKVKAMIKKKEAIK